jgi:hypothetical protein
VQLDHVAEAAQPGEEVVDFVDLSVAVLRPDFFRPAVGAFAERTIKQRQPIDRVVVYLRPCLRLRR